MKLNLGAGDRPLDGYVNLDRKTGQAIFPLPYGDGTADEIRASHVLEHFPRGQVAEVLADWVRVLKPGGRLRVAVPDFAKAAHDYTVNRQAIAEAYIMGGQVDADDFHHVLFDAGRLSKALSDAGLLLLRPWQSEIEDCAALPVSLNMEGTKPFRSQFRIASVISVPRLGFNDMWMAAIEAVLPLGITIRKVTGAFWGPNLQWALEALLAEEPALDAVITLDYDSLFTKKQVADLVALHLCHPDADCIAALQANRHKDSPLFTLPDKADNPNIETYSVPRDRFAPDLVPIRTAHFGLTLIRADRLRALPRPWFVGTPAPDGSWGAGKIDEDIHFWKAWEAAGFSLRLATRVAIGHAELMVRWPGRDMAPVWQQMSEWQETKAPPADAWKEA